MTDWLPPDQRVVITGMGAITPNGLDMPTTWENVRQGRSGIGPITLFDTTHFRVKFAGEAWGFDPTAFMTAKEARRADRFTQFALAAADEAVRDACLEIGDHNAHEVAVVVGSAAGGISTYQAQQRAMDAKGPTAMSPLLIPMIVTDSASVQVGIRVGARGPNIGITTACSTSLDTLGFAIDTIRGGDAQMAIAGGSEAAITTLGVGGFDQLRALSRRNDDPVGASRPFDSQRDGFVLSEGGVILVLESLAHAERRGAEPIAELRSYAATSDARHVTAPDTTGAGAIRCMTRAMEKARIAPAELDYINAHATGTPIGDPIEATAIKAVLGEHVDRVSVSSTKGATGHLIGAGGALEVALTALALRHQCLPPTINLTDPDPSCDVRHIPLQAEGRDAKVALVPSYGFGGHNSCVVITRWE